MDLALEDRKGLSGKWSEEYFLGDRNILSCEKCGVYFFVCVLEVQAVSVYFLM